MRGSRFLFLIMAAAVGLTFALAGCRTGADGSRESEKPDSEMQGKPSENVSRETEGQNAIYSFSSVSQMKKTVPSEKRANVLLKGYARAGDGGGGMFCWDAESVLPPDGGVVIEAQDSEKGRYVRVCESDYRNVKWFGASGDGNRDDTSPIRAAVASLPATGGTVCFPGGIYLITDTIELGNGDGSGKASDRNGIRACHDHFEGVFRRSDASHSDDGDLHCMGSLIDHPDGDGMNSRSGKAAGMVGKRKSPAAHVDLHAGKRVDQRYRICPACFYGLGHLGDVCDIRAEFHDHRLLRITFHCLRDLFRHPGILAEGDAAFLHIGA